MATLKHNEVKKHKTTARHAAPKRHHVVRHHPARNQKSQPRTMAFIIGGAILLGFVFVMMNYSVMSMDNNAYTTSTTKSSSVSPDEKERIDKWIIDENLNAYGDKKGTFYIGGTPLFNEATGKYRNLYDYIIEQHPDRPWNK